jgi:hypothetical protein
MRLPDCREMTATIGESLDRKLGWRERLEMRLHRFTCTHCERYLKQIGFLHGILEQHGHAIADTESASGSDLREESKESMKRRLALTIHADS